MSILFTVENRTKHEVNVNVRVRSEAPEQATYYVGPTNAGKTYNALQALSEEYLTNPQGRYVYAGPLRMLAYEVYEKLIKLHGEDNVGFLTGEEQINPEAPLLACTVEMAPTEGTSLVLDETHWIVDPSRGQNWTNLLIGGKYENFHILTAQEALTTISNLLNDAKDYDLKEYERKTPLNYKGTINTYNIPSKTAVVCFSRKAVYSVARTLEEAGMRVGVLYGALPLKARNAQIEKYLEGKYDVMVTTDVIGHGINLPIDNVVFVQSEKFDGQQHRKLHTWEIAQIAGRAGRYGLSEEGSVYVLTGQNWFTTDYELIQQGTRAGAGEIKTDLWVDQALITPQFGDLNVTEPTEILPALLAWEKEVVNQTRGLPISASPLTGLKQLLYTISDHLNTPLYPDEQGEWKFTAKELWTLITGPFNPEGKTIRVVSEWLEEKDRLSSHSIERHFNNIIEPLYWGVEDADNIMGDTVLPFETSCSSIGELKMVNIMFQHTGTLRYSELLEFEDRLSEAVINTIQHTIRKGKYGTCTKCHSTCSPWFKYCEECYWARR